MDLDTNMRQFEGKDVAFLNIGSKVEPIVDVPMDDGVGIEEDKLIEVKNGLVEAPCSIAKVLGNTKQLHVEATGVAKKDDLVVHFPDRPHVVSLTSKVITYSRRDKKNLGKLENKQKGAPLENQRDKVYDTNKDSNSENHLLFTPAEKDEEASALCKNLNNSFKVDCKHSGDDSGTEEEQGNFFDELERFHKDNLMEFKPSMFYGEGVNYLKLWRMVDRLGGYHEVTSRNMWRQVGESFNPPKTCTTVSWSFHNFYKKVLLEYERHKTNASNFNFIASTLTKQNVSQKEASGANESRRVQRKSEARAMQRWQSQRPTRNVSGKRKKMATTEDDKNLQPGLDNRKSNSRIVDMGPPVDWVKINVFRTKDHYELYALVPGLMCEELTVYSDPIGRVIITGEPAQLENPWGLTRFKKVIKLPSRIAADQTSATLTPYGKLYARVALDKSSP